MASVVVIALFAILRCQLIEANAIFLGSKSRHLSGQALLGGSSDLLQELEAVAGRDQRVATEARVERLERSLRPMFDALPKISDGLLGFDAVRYVLHRLFVQRHGWFVNGLDAAGDAFDSASPTEIFKQSGDHHVHGLFEGKLSQGGFDLHHVAVLAATFESLVHVDCVERLRTAYQLLGHSETEGNLSEEEVAKVVRTYMIIYVQGLNHSSLDQAVYQEASDTIFEAYPTWPDTEVFVREVRSVVLADIASSERTSWNSTLKVLEEIGERYGRWQNKECHVLKHTLVGMEQFGSGRVPLDKFYSGGLDNASWMFLESVPYLKLLGALDDSDPQRLSVIIPNYINSPTNCVASSKFYSVCCVDECDDILATLEGRIASPEASPALIVQLISGLSSDTVQAPRRLPASLMERLDEIALHHGGVVPLHGRLFAQWMHHAYPRECPYPHLSGTTKPVTAEVYMVGTNGDALASTDEIKSLLDDAKSRGSADVVMPWSHDEELFVNRRSSRRWSMSAMGRVGASFAGVASMLVAIWKVAFSDPSKVSKGFSSISSQKDLFV